MWTATGNDQVVDRTLRRVLSRCDGWMIFCPNEKMCVCVDQAFSMVNLWINSKFETAWIRLDLCFDFKVVQLCNDAIVRWIWLENVRELLLYCHLKNEILRAQRRGCFIAQIAENLAPPRLWAMVSALSNRILIREEEIYLPSINYTNTLGTAIFWW